MTMPCLKFLAEAAVGCSIVPMRITVCRACINHLSSRIPKRSFSISAFHKLPIKDVAPEPPGRTKFSGFSSAIVTIKSGNGGNGCVAFELSRTTPGRGTPSGGTGGRGGDVYIIAHGTGDLRGVPPTLSANKGGIGDINFPTPDLKRPTFRTKGATSTEMNILLELKLMADVALVGLPNAGKSTLLTQMSRANAKVGPYAFTTVSPQWGTVILRD